MNEPSRLSRWACPTPDLPNQTSIKHAAAVYKKLQAVESLVASPERLAGLELEVSLKLLSGGLASTTPDNAFWSEKCRSLLLRPSMEGIAMAYWAPLTQREFDSAKALHIGSILAGKRLIIRDKDIVGESRRRDVKFEDPVQAQTWLDDVIRASKDTALVRLLPAYCYARIILAHPYSDGNGRFARYMIHAALAHIGVTSGPVVALAPAFYRRAETMAAALEELSERNDWTGYFDVFLGLLGEAADLTWTYLGGPRDLSRSN